MGELLEGWGIWALAAGVAVAAGPSLARGLRPAAKGAIKGYLALMDGAKSAASSARSAAADVRENMQDLVEEARSEHNGAQA